MMPLGVNQIAESSFRVKVFTLRIFYPLLSTFVCPAAFSLPTQLFYQATDLRIRSLVNEL